MKSRFYSIYVIFCFFILFSCSNQRSQGDFFIQIFNNHHIFYATDSLFEGEIKTLHSGRIAMKKIKFPVYKKNTTVNIRVTVQSAGDRWDKSGSCFVIPKGSDINFLNMHEDSIAFSDIEEKFSGIVLHKKYKPVIELLRFMTPFGVGFYSNKNNGRKPVYIPHWEKKVIWEQNITDRISCLEGEVWIGIWIDSWTKEGYIASVDLSFLETKAHNFPKKKTTILPLINTIAYVPEQSLPDFFAHKDLKVKFSIPQKARNVQLKYITTGHGGHSGGDEFTKQKNTISIDGKKIFEFIPWRDDCASFRRFNPSSGVWLIKDTASYIDFDKAKYLEKVIEERIASSDLSRSNWCPGSDVTPISVKLPAIEAGEHELTISIPNAQPASKNQFNHWLVSAYLYWEE